MPNRLPFVMVFTTLGVVCATVIALVSCTTGAPSAQVQAANAVAAASNAVQPAIEKAITADNQKCVDEAASRGDAVTCFTTVETRFRPVLEARSVLFAAHNAWTAEIDAGAKPSIATASNVLNAWCALVHAMPPNLNLPHVIDCLEGDQ